MTPTKRSIEARLEDLERKVDERNERWELHFGPGMMMAPEPQLTDYLVSLGFVVEREVRNHSNGHEDVVLRTIPDAIGLFNTVLWHYEGPTVHRDDVRIMWEDDTLEATLAGVEHHVEHSEPDYPTSWTSVDEGDGWTAVAPTDRVVSNAIVRRSEAESNGHDILRSVPSYIPDADEYDLVEVDMEPLPYADRRSIPT